MNDNNDNIKLLQFNRRFGNARKVNQLTDISEPELAARLVAASKLDGANAEIFPAFEFYGIKRHPLKMLSTGENLRQVERLAVWLGLAEEYAANLVFAVAESLPVRVETSQTIALLTATVYDRLAALVATFEDAAGCISVEKPKIKAKSSRIVDFPKLENRNFGKTR